MSPHELGIELAAHRYPGTFVVDWVTYEAVEQMILDYLRQRGEPPILFVGRHGGVMFRNVELLVEGRKYHMCEDTAKYPDQRPMGECANGAFEPTTTKEFDPASRQRVRDQLHKVRVEGDYAMRRANIARRAENVLREHPELASLIDDLRELGVLR